MAVSDQLDATSTDWMIATASTQLGFGLRPGASAVGVAAIEQGKWYSACSFLVQRRPDLFRPATAAEGEFTMQRRGCGSPMAAARFSGAESYLSDSAPRGCAISARVPLMFLADADARASTYGPASVARDQQAQRSSGAAK